MSRVSGMPGPGPGLWHHAGGSAEGPLLLLLHGLGANGQVFDGLVTEAQTRWPGGWLVPDLAGHGRSGPAAPYSFDGMADGVARLVDGDRPLVIVGHSMGGVVALAVASERYDVNVADVVGLGIKVAWSEDELARAAAIAERPPKTFETRAACAEWFLKVAGLEGLALPDDPVVEAGVAERPEGWRLAMDQRCFAVGSPEMSARLAAVGCPVRLARGEHDAMVTLAQLQALDVDAIELPGLGHNAHVEAPATILDLALAHCP